MINQEKEVIEILEKYNQYHIVEHMKRLSSNNKVKIIEQVKDINFEEMINLYNKTQTKREKRNNKIEPLQTVIANKIEQSQKDKYIEAGEEVLKTNKFAVVTMAGGQGTRLRA